MPLKLGFMRMFCNFIHTHTHTHTRSVLVLDEIDQLEKEVLYTLFEYTTIRNSRLILIGESEGRIYTCYSHAPLPFKYNNSCDTVYVTGIANTLNFTESLLPRLQSTNSGPQLLHFRPYTTDQIISLLRARLGSNLVVDPMAIEFCARKIASVNGDFRKALDVCR